MPILNMNQISCQLNIFSRQIYVQGQVSAIIFSKVHIFQEGHKNWRNLHWRFDTNYLHNKAVAQGGGDFGGNVWQNS